MRVPFRRARAIVLQVLVVAGVSGVAGVSAQEAAPAPEGPRFLLAVTGRGQPVETEVSSVPLLRRRISLTLENQTIAEALKVIDGETGIEFVYRTEMATLSRRVTLRAENITVGAALTDILVDAKLDVLLSGGRYVTLVPREPTTVQANGTIGGGVTDAKTRAALAGATVVVDGTSRSATSGNDGRYRIRDVAAGTYTVRARFIGYAPGTASVTVSADQETTADFGLEKSAQPLDEVVTTGTVVPTEVKALPTPISVITAEDIQRQNLQRVDQVFRGQVPGAIAWDVGPLDEYSSITVRGASTLVPGAPTVKTYIDGVEVADPTDIARIDPNTIDRIEITRGPQASTLYGAGALNGVLQIFTKKGTPGLARPEIDGKVSAGGIGGFDGSSTALQTENAVSILGGAPRTSYAIGGLFRHVGERAPRYTSTDWGVSASGQTTQGPLTLSGLARYSDKTYDNPWDTRFQAFTPFSEPSNQTRRLRQQTYGFTAGLLATRNWQHTLTVGYDQTYLSVYQTQPAFTTPADSFLFLTASHPAKTSLLYHTDLSLRFGSLLTTTVTAGVNYDSYDLLFSYTGGATRTAGNLDGFTFVTHNPWTNTGYFGQVQFDLAEQLFLTGGLRAERNANFGADYGTAWSPRVGAAYVLGIGPATVKLRASYGESIRAPSPDERDAIQDAFSIQLANLTLAPERQRGADGGVEVYLGRASMGVTYYTQRAINLIQAVTIPTSGPLPTSQYQNLARVKNEGWEFEGRLPLGPVQLTGTYSITRSTVQQLPPDYPAGGYQVGDRILGIPYTSAGAGITYSPLARTTFTANVTYIGHWIENDWAALYAFYYGGEPYRGSDRAYWIDYPPVTKFAVGVRQDLTDNVGAFVRAENLGNTLRYEQYNRNIPTPRSVMVGANFHF